MYDCVYPTRTARFGTALVPEVVASCISPMQKIFMLVCSILLITMPVFC